MQQITTVLRVSIFNKQGRSGPYDMIIESFREQIVSLPDQAGDPKISNLCEQTSEPHQPPV